MPLSLGTNFLFPLFLLTQYKSTDTFNGVFYLKIPLSTVLQSNQVCHVSFLIQFCLLKCGRLI